MTFQFDTNFDFRSDTPAGKDPDKFSKSLKQHHKFLWSRPLPHGESFQLEEYSDLKSGYLKLLTDQSEFKVSSDSVIPTFSRWKETKSLIEQIPASDVGEFKRIGYSIGGMMIWPTQNELGGRSINVVRGFRALISDRMDLTLECIRRYYLGEQSPLFEVLSSNPKYFGLFGEFDNFVEHFLLNDLVDAKTGQVRFFLPFEGFERAAYPKDVVGYQTYRANSLDFVNARNARISRLVAEKPELFGGAK